MKPLKPPSSKPAGKAVGKLISPQRALAIALRLAKPLAPLLRPLAGAAGRCLAEPVRADRDMPPVDLSTMDGYAVLAADVAKPPQRLVCIGEVAAGSDARLRVRPGTCVAILTGAPLPPGADAVVKVEETRRDGQAVSILAKVSRGENIRRRGQEARKGAVLLKPGVVLGPAQVAICAAAGRAKVRIHPPPTVAILCTGKELRRADQTVAAHQVRDSNGPALSAALTLAGIPASPPRLVPDDPSAIERAIRSALAGHDVVLVSGGVSVGTYDFVPSVIGRIGATIRFHGVAMKPGKPLLCATLGRRLIFGLPGNPLSVLTGFHQIVLPALRRMAGAGSCVRLLGLPLCRPARSRQGRTEYHLARLVDWAGMAAVEPLEAGGSADLPACAWADGVFELPPRAAVNPGEMVAFTPWVPLG